jgi:hypothetical protein
VIRQGYADVALGPGCGRLTSSPETIAGLTGQPSRSRWPWMPAGVVTSPLIGEPLPASDCERGPLLPCPAGSGAAKARVRYRRGGGEPPASPRSPSKTRQPGKHARIADRSFVAGGTVTVDTPPLPVPAQPVLCRRYPGISGNPEEPASRSRIGGPLMSLERGGPDDSGRKPPPPNGATVVDAANVCGAVYRVYMNIVAVSSETGSSSLEGDITSLQTAVAAALSRPPPVAADAVIWKLVLACLPHVFRLAVASGVGEDFA